jgi:DHA1 family bicyclomycin/chloramphenicol resistance-like MFS transporter
LLGATWIHLIDVIGPFLLIFGYLVMQGFVFPSALALALEPFARNAGSASAMMGSLQMVAGALASAMVSFFHNGTALPMASVIAAFTAISFIVLSIGRVAIQGRHVKIL